MHRIHRYPARFGHRWHPFGGIWLIGLGLLLLGGRWWPAILLLIGISMLIGAVAKESVPQDQEEQRPPITPPSPAPVSPAPVSFAPPMANPIPHVELLPTTCPQCGGPIRSYEVKWSGSRFAICPYCGSKLPLK